MKKLSGAFNNAETKKKSSTLIKKAEDSIPRKINENDYEFIRKYAYENNLSMFESTEYIFGKIRDEYENQKDNLLNDNLEVYKSKTLKSIRISNDFNEYLKSKTNETKIPSKSILSYFISILKNEIY